MIELFFASETKIALLWTDILSRSCDGGGGDGVEHFPPLQSPPSPASETVAAGDRGGYFCLFTSGSLRSDHKKSVVGSYRSYQRPFTVGQTGQQVFDQGCGP